MAAGDEQIFQAAPSPRPGAPAVRAAGEWVFTGEDNLRLVVMNALAGVAVTIQGRVLDQAGKVGAFLQTVQPTADRMPSTFDVGVGVGLLLNCSVIVTSGAPLVGQTYVMVQAIRGLGGATMVIGCLLGGYVTAMQHLAYPGSPVESSIAGGGYIRNIFGTAPGPGGNFQETVPTGARWQFIGAFVQFTTDATAVNRRVGLLLNGAGAAFYKALIPSDQPANKLYEYSFGNGAPLVQDTSALHFLQGTPVDAVMLAGGDFRGSVANFQLGDQFSAPQYCVREWLEAA
jgi:hypothetical protein